MATILFYSPFNQRSRDTESLMIAFQQQGHTVISLTQQEGFLINDFLKSKGIAAYSFVLAGSRSGWWYYLRHLVYFIRFCWKNKIDVVYSHLEPANFVAAVGQFFIRAKVFICRHHIDEGLLYQFDKDLYYRITYRLARKIIVVSSHAKNYMVEKEGIPEKKIQHINLAYDFNLYPTPDPTAVATLRREFPCNVLLVSACRLTVFKRPEISIHTLKVLVDKGVDAKLILLGKGELHDSLQKLINDLHLNERVSMPGYVSNILDYMAACDFFIHPSLLDSSCVAVKEAGLVSKPVIVCKNIGDFDDYISFGKNGFPVSQENFSEEAATLIIKHKSNVVYLTEVGANLRSDVVRLFSIESVLPYYEQLNPL